MGWLYLAVAVGVVIMTLWMCGLFDAPRFKEDRETLDRITRIFKYHFNEKQDQHCWNELQKVARRYRYPVNMAGNFICHVDGLLATIDETESALNRRKARGLLPQLKQDLDDVNGLIDTIEDVPTAHMLQLGTSDDDHFEKRVIAWCHRYDIPETGNEYILDLLSEVRSEIEGRIKAIEEPTTAQVSVIA